MARNRKWLFKISGFFVLTVFAASCAHHPRLNPVIKVPDFYEFRVKQNNLEIAADPYDKPYKIDYLFSTDITEKGILALHIIIWNNTESEISLESASVSMISVSEARTFSPLFPDVVAQRVMNNTVARMAGFGAMGTALIFFTVPFAVGAGVDSVIANKSIKKDYTEKEMKRSDIEPKSLFHGFLFFDLGGPSTSVNSPFKNKAYYVTISGIKNISSGEAVDAKIRIELNHD